MNREFKLIDQIKSWIPRKLQGDLGIGDDADVLRLSSGDYGFTTDTIVDGVDFLLSKAKPEQVGYKALAINLSDAAAMGSWPVGFLVTIGMPKATPTAWVKGCYRGMIKLASKYRVKCLGGDLTASNQIFISITLIMNSPDVGRIQRSGAKSGDWIGTTGSFGYSIEGHHLAFEPRLREARYLASFSGMHSMMDVSDGLAQDLSHVLKASKKSAVVDLSQMKIRPSKNKSDDLRDQWKHALCDGEDFELIFTCSNQAKQKIDRAWKKKFPRTPLTWIGKVNPKQKELICWRYKETDIHLNYKGWGYEHF